MHHSLSASAMPAAPSSLLTAAQHSANAAAAQQLGALILQVVLPLQSSAQWSSRNGGGLLVCWAFASWPDLFLFSFGAYFLHGPFASCPRHFGHLRGFYDTGTLRVAEGI